MRHENSFSSSRHLVSRNGMKSVMLMVIIVMMGAMNVTEILAQSQPSAEIFVDTSNVNYPLRLTIATNTRKDVASIRVKATNPTKIVAFIGDTNKVSLYPIGEVGINISSSIGSNTLPIGSNITIARFMTDSTTRQQSFIVDFLNRNGESIAHQNIKVLINWTILLPPPCNRQVLDLTTGIDNDGNLQDIWMIDPNWIVNCEGPNGSSPAFIVIPNPNWVTSSQSDWIGINTNDYGYADQGVYTYCRTICAVQQTEAHIVLYLHADDIITEVNFNSIVYATNVANFSSITPTLVSFTTTLIPGPNILKIKVLNIPDHYTASGLNISAGSQIIVEGNIPKLSLSSGRCCRARSGWIRGHIYWDKNFDAIHNNSDEVEAGWTITATPIAGGAVQSATTDENGFYILGPLSPGTYTINEVSKTEWKETASAGPYIISLDADQSVTRDFLNYKQPTCEELFTEQNSDSVCCTGRFAISNAGNAVVTQLSFSATGGIVTGVNTGCMATTSPNLTSGLTSGTFTFNPGCANMSVQFDARSTTATGKICVLWTATFKQGTQTFTCSKSICINCIRMPKECGNPLQVTPYVFGDLNTDWRTFKLSNVKLPMSSISSVDIVLVNPPTPTHIGGGLNIDGQLRTWTFGNSTGYSKIRLNCGGGVTTAFPMGASGSNFVQFNLGIDNTINYNGIVKLKIAYCDGDTCDVDYQWTTKTRQTLNTNIDTARMYANPRMIRMKVKAPDSTRSIAFRIGDSTTTIRAITPPCGNPELDCPDIPKQFKVAAKGNSAIMTFGDGACNPDPYCYCCPPDQFTVNIAFSTAVKGDDLIRVRVIYYDQSGAEIGSSERELRSTITGINHDIDGSGIGNEIMIKGIVPNPVNESATLRFSVNESARSVTVTIVDLQGRLLKTLLDNQRIDAGEQILPFNTSSLSAGVYVVKVSADGMNNTIKLNIVR